jgi:type IV pilus assembly protein PilA
MSGEHPSRIDQQQDGFTLIELLVVIIIIGVLSAIAIPVFLSQRGKGYDAQAKSDLRNMALAEETYLTANFIYTPTVDLLVNEGFHKSPNVDAWTAVATADISYVLSVCSQSGKLWQYASMNSGISQSGTCTY